MLVRELTEGPIGLGEISKAKKRAAWHLTELLDDPLALSLFYGEQSLFHVPPTLDVRIQELMAVTTKDVEEVARRIFTAKNLHVTTVGVLESKAAKRVDRALLAFR